MKCTFVPSYLLERLSRAQDPDVAGSCSRTAQIDARLRARRSLGVAPPPAHDVAWRVHDAHNGSALPGDLVRSAGEPEVADPAVNEAATGVAQTLGLFADLGRNSYDGAGATVVSTVHYEKDYDNAFWDGTQLVFGDGDGKVFDRFTRPIDVVGHELTHAVTQYTANLTYENQSGALNESVSDVFGACVKQRHLGQDASTADWLVGEGLFLPGINGRALRSMAAPGTAYDDPQLGKDPQVGNMDDYVQTSDDNGGVHINSGIPNRAFVLAAQAIGGASWSGAGRIWFAALTSGLAPDIDFAAFADATVVVAGAHADAVRSAWDAVGVGKPAAPPVPSTTENAVAVVRSGGFAGLTKHGAVDLDSDDPRVSEVRNLVARIDFRALPPAVPQPDRFVYRFRFAQMHVELGEQALTPDLRRLAALLLEE